MIILVQTIVHYSPLPHQILPLKFPTLAEDEINSQLPVYADTDTVFWIEQEFPLPTVPLAAHITSEICLQQQTTGLEIHLMESPQKLLQAF